MKFGKPSSEKMTDEEVVERILQGEMHLQEVIYDRYSGKIFHKCISLIKDREAAKDCTHDIMVKILMKLADFKGRSAFSLWIHSITYNYCMDYLSKQKRLDFSDYTEYEYENVADDGEALEMKLLQDLKLTQLEAVLEQLKPDEKLILMMYYQDNMSVKDIADTLSIGESAAKMRLKRSREHLGELIIDLDKKQKRG